MWWKRSLEKKGSNMSNDWKKLAQRFYRTEHRDYSME